MGASILVSSQLQFNPLRVRSQSVKLHTHVARYIDVSCYCQNTDWNKYDDRLMKAVERGEVDKVAAVLSKKGIIPTKLDVEGRSA